MKLKLSNLVIYSLLAVLLVGAVAKANDYGYIPSSRYTGPNSHIYDLGYKDGSEDARKGLSALTSRHGGYTKDQLEIFAQGYTTGYRNYSRPSYSGGGQSYEAFKGQGKVTITRNGREVAVCRTAQPDVEKWHFMEGHEQIVIKSRGERGTAVVQLFDARTGNPRDKVSAYAIRHGEPEWARGMQDFDEPTRSDGFGYIPSSRYTGPNSHIYDLGYKDGSEDARKGLSALTSRHGGYTKDQLEIFAQGYTTGYRNYSRPGYSGGGQSYEAFKGPGKVTITRNGREVAVCRTAQPDVEKWHFMEGHEQIVIKSRGERGTAVVQLFDARTGTPRDKVSAYAIRHGEPEWARGMQD